MKAIVLLLGLICLFNLELFSQGKYTPVSRENYNPFYDDCSGIEVKVPTNAPWYVASDRAENVVYSGESGSGSSGKVEMGRLFLVIGQSGDRLKVVEADKVVITMSSGTWAFKAGVKSGEVVQGWIPKSNLLLSQKCLKVCDPDIPEAPKGLYNLQGLYIYNVSWKNDNHKYFTHIPPGYQAGTPKTPLNESDRFGYIFKIQKFNGVDWYLIGEKAEIRLGDRQIILKGWKPKEQVELWKHRLALEYDWQNVPSRVSSGIRLNITRDPHSGSVSRDTYEKLAMVDKEYNYKKGTASKNYYYERELGTGFRSVILKEDPNNIQVGVLKNSCNVDEAIVNPARAIANEIAVQMLRPKVIFVLDGTESLNDQQQNIISTIKSTVTKIIAANQGSAIEYEFYATVYRDKLYNNFIFEKMDNFAGVDAIGSWINANLTATGKNSGDRDQPEAVFYGLNETFKAVEANKSKSFFNPTFYVLIGDCGSEQRKDDKDIPMSTITDNLKCDVSDLVAIQFAHDTQKSSNGVPDNGKSFDLFQTQFRDILKIFGTPKVSKTEGGTIEEFPGRPGSFLAYPERDKAFTEASLSSVIQQALMNYNSTVQEKIIQLALELRNKNSTCPQVKKELEGFIRNYIQRYNLDIADIEQVIEWSTRFIENIASTFQSRSGSKIEINADCYNFFNPGYVAARYGFFNYSPYKHVIYINNNNLDRIREFARTISMIKGGRPEIQRSWYQVLMITLGVFQDVNQVNALTIGEATSILTGFKGSSKYEKIKIGELTQTSVFPDKLMYEYIFEWGITYGYLESVRNGTWKLESKNLRAQIPIINAILKSRGKPPVNEGQLKSLSDKLAKKDTRPLNDYYKGYPNEELDVMYKVKAYWIESDFFSTQDFDFVEQLLNVVDKK